MDTAAVAALSSWTLEPWVTIAAALAVAVYARGWRKLHRQLPEHFGRGRLVAFIAGVATLLVAVGSPLDALANLLLQAHMVQHFLLMMVVPPLIWAAWPFAPMTRGLPGRFVKEGLGPFLTWPGLRRAGRFVLHPVVGWVSFVAMTWTWHAPVLYERALVSASWHRTEHACFFVSALLFWHPVVQPWPSRSVWPRWAMIPYLLLADVQNTALGALFAFGERLFYPAYAVAPGLFGLSPLDDQAAAGAIMWVFGSVAFLLPVAVIVTRSLQSRGVRPSEFLSREVPAVPVGAAASLEWSPATKPWDLLRARTIGRIAGWPHLRRVLQGGMLVVAAAVVIDGLFGTQVAPMNLAGVLPWTYWRGLAVVALLVGGNLFCMSCPFMLPRALGRRWITPRATWPAFLRSKWPALGLVVLYLWAYEVFDLWNRPSWTAWIVIGYFVAAFAVDAVWKGASFCKYVCPIGQFHFVQSTVSPLEIKIRDPHTCERCETLDCIKGNRESRGCELELFQPRKSGNLDCTFCLDCVHACPHDNVGILAVAPGLDLARDDTRSGIGKLSARADIVALAVVLTFGAFVNAAGMIAPVNRALARLADAWGLSSTTPVVASALPLALLVVPAVLVMLTGRSSRVLGRLDAPPRELTRRFSLALVPLGFAMWLAHFGFHLVAGRATAIAPLLRVARGLGLPGIDPSLMHALQGMVVPSWLLPLELLALDAGLLTTLYVAFRISTVYAANARRAVASLLPWGVLAASLWLAGIWILLQPMQMRGM